MHFYTQKLFTQKHSHTQTRLQTKTFTHGRFYTQTLLHRFLFIHKHLYTQTSLHRNTLTHEPIGQTKTNSEDEFRRQIYRKRIGPWRRIPTRRRIPKTNLPNMKCPPKKRIPKMNSPKTNCLRRGLRPKTNSPKTNSSNSQEDFPEDEFRRDIFVTNVLGKKHAYIQTLYTCYMWI